MRITPKTLCGIAVAVFASVPTAALSCSYAGNTYERLTREPLTTVLDRAVYVEMIEVSAAGPPSCPPPPSSTPDGPEWTVWRAALPAQCRDSRRPGAGLTARATERFKGQGADTYALHLGFADQSASFSDVRSLGQETAEMIRAGEARRASSGHHDPAFWLQGDIGFAHDMTDSCGGEPLLVPGIIYVVFRNAAGDVTAAEPVSTPDDEFVVWLREAGEETPARPARRFSPAEALGAASNLTLVRIRGCRRQYGEQVVIARPVRGTSNTIFQGEDADPQGGLPTLYLGEWLTHHRLSCQPRTVLVVETDGSGRVWIPPMPASVGSDSVMVADLFPGVPLTGPERITVDQAFAWFGSRSPD